MDYGGLWGTHKAGWYRSQPLRKKDLRCVMTDNARLLVRYNKFYEKDSGRPKFIFAFADDDTAEAITTPRVYIDTDYYTDEDGNRLYTKDEVRRVISGAVRDAKSGYSAEDLLISDYV